MSIFVQIASYRDPQLVPTIRDCLEKARFPDHLFFGIAWQHGPEETLPEEWFSHPNFSILDIPFQESQGACWARHYLQKLYRGEEYTLQLDSHHRFAQDWDSRLIEWILRLQKMGFPKPVLTSYLPSFDPEDDPSGRCEFPYELRFQEFSDKGVLLMKPHRLHKWKYRKHPVPSRFYSAHFCFTIGLFCKEVPHDPQLYFHGEEISIAVRAFTHGYDLFHPHRIVAWHEYTRKNRIKHWEENSAWEVRDMQSKTRYRSLLGIDGIERKDLGEFGLGKVRSLQDYEAFAGISFAHRQVDESWGR